MGEPGMGKSRLLAACWQRLPARPVTVLEGHCRSYDQRIPYGPISDLPQQQGRLRATGRPPAVRPPRAPLPRAVGMPPAPSAPSLPPLLGSPATEEPLAQLPPDVIKERTFAT